MDQAKQLKWSAIAFTIFWVGAMLWWSGEHHLANIVILTICGSIAGYLWYLAMSWTFQRLQPLPPNGDHGAGGETP
jgi:glycopeptide antibiotics resistance protein